MFPLWLLPINWLEWMATVFEIEIDTFGHGSDEPPTNIDAVVLDYY